MENSNAIEIHQAYFGEVNKSHGCLFTTLNDDKLNSYLTAFSDKPYPIPVGITLGTYFAATVFNYSFIVTKTIPDATASRPGMVFTHALIIKLPDIEKVSDLRKLLSHFASAVPNKVVNIVPIIFEVPEKPQIPAKEVFAKYIQEAAERMIMGKKVAFFGELSSFIEMLITIWDGLPAQLRKFTTFNVGFSRNDIENKNEPILHFQKELSGKIVFEGAINDNANEEIKITNNVEKLILGDRQSNDFEIFLNSIDCKLTDFNQLTIAEKAYASYKQLDSLQPDDLRQLMRLIGKLSPMAKSGVAIKNTILGKLLNFIDLGNDYKIKALRNLDLRGFPDAESSLSHSISGFVSNQFLGTITFDPVIINGLVEIFAESTSTDWWNEGVKKGLKDSISEPKSIGSIWKLLMNDGTKLTILFSILPEKSELENRLIRGIPQHIDTPSILKIKPLLKDKKWNVLYANLSLVHLQPQAALKEQLVLEEGLSLQQSVGIPLIASKISNERLLELYLAHPDAKLLNLITSRLIKDPSPLENLDVFNSRWLDIWNATLKHSNDIGFGMTNMIDKVEQLYELIIKGKFLPEPLMHLLSQSQYADASKFSRRSELLKTIPVLYKPLFLTATSLGLTSKIAAGLNSAEQIETELLDVMSSDQFVTSYLSTYRADLNAGINYFQIIPNLKDQFLADYINYYSGTVPEITSLRLGNMVFERNYSKSAESIFQKSKSNSSFRIALNKVKEILHLNIFDKVLYGHLFGDNINDEIAFFALYEIVKDLYKKGPEDENIWERAGGDVSKLVNQNSREENWRRALHLLRYGGAGQNISVKSLLKEINAEFAGNLIIRELKDYFKNR